MDCGAAIDAAEAGAEILILEKAPEEYAGGNSSCCGGGNNYCDADHAEECFLFERSLMPKTSVADEEIMAFCEEMVSGIIASFRKGNDVVRKPVLLFEEIEEIDRVDCLHVRTGKTTLISREQIIGFDFLRTDIDQAVLEIVPFAAAGQVDVGSVNRTDLQPLIAFFEDILNKGAVVGLSKNIERIGERLGRHPKLGIAKFLHDQELLGDISIRWSLGVQVDEHVGVKQNAHSVHPLLR